MNALSKHNLEILEPLPTSVSTSTPTTETQASLLTETVLKTEQSQKISKQAIRASLKASTTHGIFTTVFTNITGGVLLTNFLLKLGGTSVDIGLVFSIPLLVNFLQPLGAHIADRTQSRHWYTLTIIGFSRLLWLVLVAGIMWLSWSDTDPHQLVTWTLGIILITNILGALGTCAWFSWMAALVPHRLRGRYFGFRNSATSLTNLLCTPLFGFALSALPGDTIQNYGMLLSLGVVIGVVSLVSQFWMTDMNPQATYSTIASSQKEENLNSNSEKFAPLKDTNFLKFLLYVGLWTFAINISTPFLHFYMLHDLALNIRTVTLYSSILAGANIIMLMFWGKLADRIGNRPLLLLACSVITIIPFFWMSAKPEPVFVWVWIPLTYFMCGGFGAAIELCNNNIQMSVAPKVRPSQYYALAAAVIGVCGGLGSITGGFLAQIDIVGGVSGLFVLSAALRFIALLPLVFVQEPHSQPMTTLIRSILPSVHRKVVLKGAFGRFL
ncbi:MAG: MFS transporter [Scytonema sp. PMC 1069.18]|nr:MFS transporter [Scytonema sp. PMC 1069.18]MEC4884212.1 MFS transporter [Scytonema sp. PMC 1070.18]